ncbi:MAG: 2-oxo acid dehydrogenase subunit E2 [Ignavibacteria bacterium]
MNNEFKLPELGENIKTADVLTVLIKPGDAVKIDQTVFEIETDKATIEVPSTIEGVVTEVYVKAGDKVAIGQTLFITGDDKSVVAEGQSVQIEVTTAIPEVKKVAAEEKPAPEPAKVKTYIESKPESDPGRLAPAAPTVRRFAREIGININDVQGSGPGGRISIIDVKAHSQELSQRQAQIAEVPKTFGGAPAEQLPDFTKWGAVEKKDMSNIRRKTAEHLSYAWATVPHVTQFDKADITELERLRKAYGNRAEAEGGRLTVTAIMLKVVASALKAYPQFNTSVDIQNSTVIYKKFYNIGVAVDTDRGLLVPVIKNVDKKNIIELSVELSRTAERAKNKKLSLEEMQGGTFTITNLGGIGGTYFSPIVNSPEVAILGLSRSAYEPVYIDGEFKPRLMLPLSLSYDHRIIDGADGARFLKWIVDAIQQPFLMALEG